jgi:hypothetical protein
LPSWIRIRICNLNADPDPATQINADPCGSGYGSGSETLPRGINFPRPLYLGKWLRKNRITKEEVFESYTCASDEMYNFFGSFGLELDPDPDPKLTAGGSGSLKNSSGSATLHILV